MNKMIKLSDTPRFKELETIIAKNLVPEGTCPACKSNKVVVEYPQNYPGDFSKIEVCLDCGATIT